MSEEKIADVVDEAAEAQTEIEVSSPWASADELTPAAFLSSISPDAPIRLPGTNIVIDTDEEIIEETAFDATDATYRKRAAHAAHLLDSLAMGAIPTSHLGDMKFTAVEGQPVTLHNKDSYTLSNAALSNLLTILKIDWKTFQNVQDYTIRENILNHRLTILSAEIMADRANKALSNRRLNGDNESEVGEPTLFIAFHRTDDGARYATAITMAPADSLEIDDIYPRQMLNFAAEDMHRHGVKIYGMKSNSRLITSPSEFFKKDEDGELTQLINSTAFLTLSKEDGGHQTNVRITTVDPKMKFSMAINDDDDGKKAPQRDDIFSRSQFTASGIKTGQWIKDRVNGVVSSIESGVYRLLCSNGMSVLASGSDVMKIAVKKFFKQYAEAKITLTYRLRGEMHEDTLTNITMDIPEGASEFALTADENDAELQQIVKDVRMLVADAKRKSSITRATAATLSAMYEERRSAEKQHLPELLNTMVQTANIPIFANLQTNLSAKELILHLISGAKEVSSRLRMDNTVVRDVCVALLILARKGKDQDLFAIRPWQLLNLVTLAAKRLEGEKRADLENKSAAFVLAVCAFARQEAQQNRSPASSIATGFARLIHAG